MKYIKQFESVNKRYNTDEFLPFVDKFFTIKDLELKKDIKKYNL